MKGEKGRTGGKKKGLKCRKKEEKRGKGKMKGKREV